MNRRSFLKLAGTLLPAFFLKDKKPMATNGQLLAKSLRGETLLESEIMQLERAMDNFDRSERYTLGLQNGTEKLNVSEIQSKDAFFDKAPTHVFRVARINSAQSINNNTSTVVSFDYADDNNREFTRDGSKVYLLHPHRFVAVMGIVSWANNANDSRYMELFWRNAAGGNEDTHVLMNLPPTAAGTGNFQASFCDVFDFKSTPNGKYFQFEVYQKTGGALNMERFRATFFILQ